VRPCEHAGEGEEEAGPKLDIKKHKEQVLNANDNEEQTTTNVKHIRNKPRRSAEFDAQCFLG
jgi:hypothetical protein